MGINDYGDAGQGLDAPALGGAGGWAESVAIVLNGSDTTVDDRIAANPGGMQPDDVIAGTNITIGRTSTTATINASPATVDDIPAGSVLAVAESGGSYTRPTGRTDVVVIFTGESDPGGTALDGDKWDRLS